MVVKSYINLFRHFFSFSVTKIKVILEILFVRELLAPFLAELYPEVKESIWILLSSTESNLTWSFSFCLGFLVVPNLRENLTKQSWYKIQYTRQGC